MTDRCEPPPEWRDHCWHWLKIHDNSIVAFWWNGEGWRRTLGSLDPVEMACAGYTYVAPCRPDDATERVRLEAENARLKADLNIARQGLLIVSGQSQCVDNLLSNQDVALEALRLIEEPDNA